MPASIPSFWSLGADELLEKLGTRPEGLSDAEASRRLAVYGKNSLGRAKKNRFLLLASQFNNPIIFILLAVSLISFFLHDPADSTIIIIIVLISSFLGFWQEKGADEDVSRLLAIVHVKADMLRDGREIQVPIEEAVPGDITLLSAGDSIPGDCRILSSDDLEVDESTLTGESLPVGKKPGIVAPDARYDKRVNSLFMGTHVVSGTAKALVVNTGRHTGLAGVSGSVGRAKPPTDFELGIRRFGFLIMVVSLLMVGAIFLINIALRKPPVDSFLFSLSLAVGLTPQLLPAIISVNLARGAMRLVKDKVIVKRLAAIENLGSMNILCSDKTGTLTEGRMKVHSALDPLGAPCARVLLYAYLTARLTAGFRNPVDKALNERRDIDTGGFRKIDEALYDFERKRMSMLLERDGKRMMVTKGAVHSLLSVCDRVEITEGRVEPLAPRRPAIMQKFDELGDEGLRVLGVAYRELPENSPFSKAEEKEMVFIGFLALADPLKEGISGVVERLEKAGVELKIVTGDNEEVARYVCKQVFGREGRVTTGEGLRGLDRQALAGRLGESDVYAEIDPLLKERIIRGYRDRGNVVGYLGDGINDTPALHACDAAITVNSAVDVAKETADIVLLEKDLGVLTSGIYEGRRTFVNTLKYVFMATSANFGGTFSYLGTSLFLPFLPLLPKQVLLNNLLTDIPAMTLPEDTVDPGAVKRPRRWDIGFISRFMVTFGLLSSAFDYLTFGVLIFFFRADEKFFHTGWFVESVVTSVLIVFAIRTRKPFFASKPGALLLWASLVDACLVCLVVPFTGLGSLLGFIPLPPSYFPVLLSITGVFFLSAEGVKRFFYRRFSF